MLERRVKVEDFDKLKAQKDAIVERNLRDNIQKLLTNDEDWWLIERKPWSNEPDGNLFFTGNSWSNSALKAARFKTKGDAQNVIDNMIDGITLKVLDKIEKIVQEASHFVEIERKLAEIRKELEGK